MQEAKDPGEYDQEGDMSMTQLRSIIYHAQELHDQLDKNDNLPEWVQSKITLAQDYVQTACDYMYSQKNEEVVQEKRGLWDNIHAKRQRIKNGSGESMRKPGSEGAPSAEDLKNSQVKEEVKGEYERKVDTYLKKKYGKDKSQKKLPQGSDFAAARRKERLASNGRMDEEVEQIDEVASHAELAASAHKAYIAATSQGLVHVANYYLERHKKHKSIASKEKKKGVAEEVEQMDEEGLVEGKKPPISRMYKVGWNHGTEDEYHDEHSNDPEYNRGHGDGLSHASGPSGLGRKNTKRFAVAEEVEQMDEGRPSQQHPIEGHEYHKKSDAELRYILKDAGTAAKAMKDHSPRAESKYLDQVNDASTVLSFRQRNGTPAWYKKKYDHVNESVDTPPFTPDAPKKNSGVVVGKRPEGMSKARHLARLAMKGELNKKKTVKEDSSNDVEKTNTPAKRTVSKTTMIVKNAAKSSKDKKNKDKFEAEPELSSQIVRNNF